MHKKALYAFFFLLSSAICKNAEAQIFGEKDESLTWEQSLIRDNMYISEWFDGMAEGLDLFLVGRKMTDRRNETTVVLESNNYYNEKDSYRSAFNLNVNLRLPNFEEYWQITFTSYDENEDRGIANSYLRRTPRDQEYGARLGFFRKLGNVRAAFQPRVTFAGTPKISHSVSFESIAENHEVRINPKLEFYASADKGPGVFQAINFNFEINKYYSITQINEGDYEDRSHVYNITNGVALNHWINRVSFMNYNFFVLSQNRPNYQIAEYIVSVAWNHQLYRNVFDYQLIPNISFSRDYNFVANPGITLNMSVKF